MNKKEIKFVVDVGVGKKVEKRLLDNGYDLIVIRDIDPKMNDDKILNISASDKRMIITMDKDFGELVYNSGLSHSGV